MNTVRLVLKEFVGLFIDDGSLAIAILVAVGLIAALLHYGLMPPIVGGLLLFLGLAAILIENLLRSARRFDGR
jgi:hypothetical protein